MNFNRNIFKLIILFLFFTSSGFAQKIRPPSAAGTFYPGSPDELRSMINIMLEKAPDTPLDGKLVAVIAPHAGYIYSGQVAANTYKLLKNKKFDIVCVVAPSHRDAFRGVSVYPGDGYQTPLGVLEIDKKLAKKLTDISPITNFSQQGHQAEHSLEVQLPFLQVLLGNFKLLPLVMGDQNYNTVTNLGKALADVLKNENALIVASSDLSHYHTYDDAVKLGKKLLNAVKLYDYLLLSRHLATGECEACGGGPIISVMIAAQNLGANKARIISYGNSGDVTNDKSAVVGYMSSALVKSGDSSENLNAEDRKKLVEIAKTSVFNAVKGIKIPDFKVSSESLKQQCGAFVTLNKNGELRGCIGYIIAEKPLYQTVEEVAVSASLRDPRFPPVSEKELNDLSFEVSVLTPFRLITDINEIEVGKHGLFVIKGTNQGVLLPQVASQYHWDKNTFLE
ncbi:MAG: AmmeMemoRadiSam system protein B, partial [bacterium]